jgi:hypothetical protein
MVEGGITHVEVRDHESNSSEDTRAADMACAKCVYCTEHNCCEVLQQ